MLQAAGLKICRYCGSLIDINSIICPICDRQVKQLYQGGKRLKVIQVDGEYFLNMKLSDFYTLGYKKKRKWKAFLLCLFFGIFGAHKIYEEKYFLAVLYFLTLGLCGIGWLIDMVVLLFRKSIYYVK